MKATGCNGWCEKGPLVKIMPDDITYCRVKLSDVAEIIEKTLILGQVINRLLYRDPLTKEYFRSHHETDFYRKQRKVALKNIGEVDPGSIDDYLAHGGYRALKRALAMSREEIVQEVIATGLRGRGGGDFHRIKWQACAKMKMNRYIIQWYESDPGAFMDRALWKMITNVLGSGHMCLSVGATRVYLCPGRI